MFEELGTVQSAQVIMDRESGRSKGFGFVEMGTDQEAQAAIKALNGKDMDGRALTVNEAKPREDRGGGGGRGGYGRRRWRKVGRRPTRLEDSDLPDNSVALPTPRCRGGRFLFLIASCFGKSLERVPEATSAGIYALRTTLLSRRNVYELGTRDRRSYGVGTTPTSRLRGHRCRKRLWLREF